VNRAEQRMRVYEPLENRHIIEMAATELLDVVYRVRFAFERQLLESSGDPKRMLFFEAATERVDKVCGEMLTVITALEKIKMDPALREDTDLCIAELEEGFVILQRFVTPDTRIDAAEYHRWVRNGEARIIAD